MANRFLYPLPALLLLAGACGGTDGAEWRGTVTDSAGIEVVHNPAEGIWASDAEWTLSEEYRVGGLDAPAEAQFGQVIGLSVDAAGNVYIADQQASQIQIFGPDGMFLRTLGSPGSGPGELGPQVMGVWVVEGEIWVADLGNQRINRYDPDGGHLGSEPLDFSRGVPIRWDQVGGRVIAQIRGMAAMGMDENPMGDPVLTMGGADRDTLANLGKGQSLELGPGGQARFSFFAPEPIWDASADGRIASGRNAEYRIEIRDANGDLTRVVTKASVPQEVSEDDQEKILAAMRELMLDQGAPPPAVDQMLQGASFAEHYPAMGQIVLGPEGTIWAQQIRTAADATDLEGGFNPQDMGSDRWEVFDAEGRYLGVLQFPVRFMPLLVEENAFWGVQRDALDVQSVVRYRLIME